MNKKVRLNESPSPSFCDARDRQHQLTALIGPAGKLAVCMDATNTVTAVALTLIGSHHVANGNIRLNLLHLGLLVAHSHSPF